MAFENRSMARQRVRYDNANDELPLVYQLDVNGEKVTPTSATIAIYKNGETTASQSATAMTVSGTLMTYVLDTSTETTWTKGAYRADVVVTYSSKTYEKHFFFDIVPYVFDANIGFDQLVALDDGLRGMTWDNDSSFKQLIVAAQDSLKVKIEAKVVKDKKLVQDMVIDNSALSVAYRFYILGRIWRAKGNEERAGTYFEEFSELFEALLSTIKYDSGLGGTEPTETGGIQETQFVT
jgi:hypothetical protein